jgi:hypothetical protein
MDSQIQQIVEFFVTNGTQWVKSQRARYWSAATPIDAQLRDSLSPFFSQRTLDAVRIIEVAEIENPDFYSVFAQSGQPLPLDFRQMAGITFADVVLISTGHRVQGESVSSLMFHELVHVAQYGILGIDEFIRRYVVGWASAGFDYSQIPLEQDAYFLQGQFDQGLTSECVEHEVARRLGFVAPVP